MSTSRAIMLISGGIDSAVALWWARQQGWELVPLTFHSYRRASREVVAVRSLLTDLELDRLVEVAVPFLREVDDLGQPLSNPHLRNAPDGYIPARNLVYYAIAAHYAEIACATRIVGGHNRLDSRRYPDAGEPFFRGFNELCRRALYTGRKAELRVVLPLHGLTKTEILRKGLEMGVPLERTWSCYFDGEQPCGECVSCRERAAAFSQIGVTDPLRSSQGRTV